MHEYKLDNTAPEWEAYASPTDSDAVGIDSQLARLPNDSSAEQVSVADDSAMMPDPALPLGDHLAELRRRLIWCLLFWLVGCCFCYGWTDKLLNGIRALSGDDFYFVFTSPTEAFMAYLKLSMLMSLFACAPIVVYHAVAFACPGLRETERKWLLRLVPCSLVLFASGVAFAWSVVIPFMWKFLLGFQSESVRALWSIGEVVGFVSSTMLLCGCLFQTPIILIFLVALGIVTVERLVCVRRAVYLGAVIAAAVITPTPDGFTALVVALPLALFYELSLLVIRVCRIGEKATIH